MNIQFNWRFQSCWLFLFCFARQPPTNCAEGSRQHYTKCCCIVRCNI